MKKTKQFLAFALILLVGASSFAQQKQPVDYADPLLGTSESRWMLTPGPTLPFGMVQLSPDNQSQNWKAGYEYTIGSIFGFSHIHAWTMAGLSVMPTNESPLCSGNNNMQYMNDNGSRVIKYKSQCER